MTAREMDFLRDEIAEYDGCSGKVPYNRCHTDETGYLELCDYHQNLAEKQDAYEADAEARAEEAHDAAMERWAENYEDLNGAPDGEEDR